MAEFGTCATEDLFGRMDYGMVGRGVAYCVDTTAKMEGL